MAVGDFVGKFGSFGTGDGQFNFIQDVDTINEKLYISDATNYRVEIFQGNPAYIPGAKGGGGSGGGGASGRRLKTRYTGRSLGR